MCLAHYIAIYINSTNNNNYNNYYIKVTSSLSLRLSVVWMKDTPGTSSSRPPYLVHVAVTGIKHKLQQQQQQQQQQHRCKSYTFTFHGQCTGKTTQMQILYIHFPWAVYRKNII